MSTTAAESAWSRRNARVTTPRAPYLAGYEDGAFDERLRVVGFLADNMEALTEFAGDRTPELIAYMFREMESEAAAEPTGEENR